MMRKFPAARQKKRNNDSTIIGKSCTPLNRSKALVHRGMTGAGSESVSMPAQNRRQGR
jgi:hypothetical protein